MTAAPAHRDDPGSVWVSAPNGLAPVLDALLGSNPYQARTGVFTGGANAVYRFQILERTGNTLRVTNLAEKARRKAPPLRRSWSQPASIPLFRAATSPSGASAAVPGCCAPTRLKPKSIPLRKRICGRICR